MTAVPPATAGLDPASAAAMLANFGFLASPDLPDRPGPAYLMVALRATPTLRHFDPEGIQYWVSEGGRGASRTLTRNTPVPIETDFSWGLIRIVDRLHVTNEYLTFGGRLSAESVDGTLIAVFTSPAPILRRGGHSQGWDPVADRIGAYFSRFLAAVDFAPGFESRAAAAEPVTRYAAFLADTLARYRSSPAVREAQSDIWTLIQAEERRMRATHPADWTAGEILRNRAVW